MSLIAVRAFIFPGGLRGSGTSGASLTTADTISAINGGWGYVFVAPKAMTVNRIGLYFQTVAASVTLDAAFKTVSAGLPTSTNAGGSSPTTMAVTGVGRAEAVFSTGASLNAGDLCAAILTQPAVGSGSLTNAKFGANLNALPGGSDYYIKNAAGSSWAIDGSTTSAAAFDVGNATETIPLAGSVPITALNTIQTSTTQSIKVWGAKFTARVPMRTLGVSWYWGSTGRSGAFKLLDASNNVLATATFDTSAAGQATAPAIFFWDGKATYNLSAGTTYRLVFVPNSTSLQSLYDITVPANFYLDAHAGIDWFLTTNTSLTFASSWDTSTAYPVNTSFPVNLKLFVDQIDDGTAGGPPPAGGASMPRIFTQF